MSGNRLTNSGQAIEGASEGYKVDTPESLFHRAMVSIFDYVLLERRYDANSFLDLLVSRGGVMTARDLLSSPGFGAGFEGLWKPGPVERTMEYLVLQPKFCGLFTDEEKDTARDRLIYCGYIPGPGSQEVIL